MAGVGCTHMAMGWIGGVLYSRVVRTRSGLRGPMDKVDVWGFESRIRRVVRKPQLGISKRFESSFAP